MKKLLILAVLLGAAAFYFGVITIRTGEGEFSVGVNEQRASEVMDMAMEKVGLLKEVVQEKK